jgi:hypothetical protein
MEQSGGVGSPAAIRPSPVIHPHIGGYLEFVDGSTPPLRTCPAISSGSVSTGHQAMRGWTRWSLRASRPGAYFHFRTSTRHQKAVADELDLFAAIAGVFYPLGSGVVDFSTPEAGLAAHAAAATTIERIPTPRRWQLRGCGAQPQLPRRNRHDA